jgi:hypothetical protein
MLNLVRSRRDHDSAQSIEHLPSQHHQSGPAHPRASRADCNYHIIIFNMLVHDAATTNSITMSRWSFATMLALSCALCTSAAPTVTVELKKSLLHVELIAGGLDPPQGLANILNDLGLHTMQDVRLLNTPEQLELAVSLRTAGVGLGSRSKLRRLSEATTLNSNVFRGCAPFDLDRHAFEGTSEAARRLQESKLRESEGRGPARRRLR